MLRSSEALQRGFITVKLSQQTDDRSTMMKIQALAEIREIQEITFHFETNAEEKLQWNESNSVPEYVGHTFSKIGLRLLRLHYARQFPTCLYSHLPANFAAVEQKTKESFFINTNESWGEVKLLKSNLKRGSRFHGTGSISARRSVQSVSRNIVSNSNPTGSRLAAWCCYFLKFSHLILLIFHFSYI